MTRKNRRETTAHIRRRYRIPVVIALVYTDDLSLRALVVGAVIFALLLCCNALGIRRPSIYLCGGIALWLATVGSGVHATTAGIIAALAIPARPTRSGRWASARVRRLMQALDAYRDREKNDEMAVLAHGERHAILDEVRSATEQASTPLQRFEGALEKPVALFVLPLFALVNAGVELNFRTISALWENPPSIGILLGLLVGKTLGITLGAWFALRSGIGDLPRGMTLNLVAGVGMLGGIGFTMSIFIAGLAFEPGSTQLESAKVAILFASLLAAIIGATWIARSIRKIDPIEPAAPLCSPGSGGSK